MAKKQDSAADQPTGEGESADMAGAGNELPPVDVGQRVEQEQGDNAQSAAAAESGDQQEREQEHAGTPPTPEAPFGYKKDGTPRISNAGRRPVSASDESDKQRARLRSVSPGARREKQPAPIAVTPLAVVNYQAMGESVASMFFSVGTLALGPDWEPDTKEGEHLAVAGAFRDYFKATNMRDLPPGFALCFVLGVYTLKRAAKPTIKSKLQGAGLWLKNNLRIRR